MKEKVLEKKKEGGQPGNTNALKWTEEKALQVAEELLVWLAEKPKFHFDEKGNPQKLLQANIFFRYFLAQKDLDQDLIAYLMEKYKSFAEKIKKAKFLQETKLGELSVTGFLNPAMSIFMLKNHHAYTDRQDISIDKMRDAEKIKFEW